MERFKLLRIIDDKPCYQYEADIQQLISNQYFDFLNLRVPKEIQKRFKSKGIHYMVKFYTLQKALKILKRDKKDLSKIFYTDLDILYSDHINFNNITSSPIVGNIYWINWEIAFPYFNKNQLPGTLIPVYERLVKTHRRYSTMFFRMDLFDEYIQWIEKELTWKKFYVLEKLHYNKYFEEFIWSLFIEHKHSFSYQKCYNLYIRKIENFDVNDFCRDRENHFEVKFYHLTTEWFDKFRPDCFKNFYRVSNTTYNKIKGLIENLSRTKKYLKSKRRKSAKK